MAAYHYCSTCDQRVYPYSGMESATLAPEEGVNGPILLSSYNGKQRGVKGSVQAWCFNCDDWRGTYRLEPFDLIVRYAARRGVRFRFADQIINPNGERTRRKIADLIAGRLEDRALGAGRMTVESKRRR